MKYTKDQLRGAVEALAETKARLAARKNTFICFALADNHPESYVARAIVMLAISPHATFGQWLQVNNGFFPSCRGLQKLRLLWIDKLIKDINQQIAAAP